MTFVLDVTTNSKPAAKTAPVAQSAHELAHSLRLAGRPEEAVKVLRTASHTERDDYRWHEELGTALAALNRHEEAIGAFLVALQHHPNSAEICGKVGESFYARGMFQPAVDWFQRSRNSDPNTTTHLYQFGKSLTAIGCYKLAAEVFNQLLQADPDNAIARHMSIATLGAQEIPKASADYVCALFNGCAERFDETLGRLGYRGPEIVLSALKQVGLADSDERHVLDLGCGTGLVGAAIRPLARRLVGVDLSHGMLERARQRDVYDDLFQAEVVEFLGSQSCQFDIITASDVLTYIGDLGEFALAAAQALRPGGLIVVVGEMLKTPAGEAAFRLNPTGRFSHSSPYLYQVIQDAGMVMEALSEDVMRSEGDKPVPTFVVVGRKPA